MTTAVAPRIETPSPSSVPVASMQLETAQPPSPAQAELYRLDWWGLQIWVAGVLILAGLHMVAGLGRLWRWLF
jgi:hypothetical protein